MELLSIIVPVYGEDEFLDECIGSIVNQTYSDLEIILVDDGSPDRCPDICDSWSNKDSRIKVIHKKNGGLVSARKEGMKCSTGEYIGYVDGDDWIDDTYFESQIMAAEKTGADVVISGYTKDLFGNVIGRYGNGFKGLYNLDDIEKEIIPNMMYSVNTNTGCINTYVWNKLFKRQVVFDSQLAVDDSGIIGLDSFCTYPTIWNADKIFFNDSYGYHYRQRMNSLLRCVSFKKESIEKLGIFYEGLYREYTKSKYSGILNEQLKHFYINHLIMMSDSLVQFYTSLEKSFPFSNIEQNSNIAIYSAGAYGIHLYNQMISNSDYHISLWVDPDHKDYIGNDSRVDPVEKLYQTNWDYCLIASTDRTYVNSVMADIISHGVSRACIRTVFDDWNHIEKELKRIGVL